MRIFSQFVPRTARIIVLLLLTLTFARPVSSQNTAPGDTIQVIALQQKMISQAYKLERAGDLIMQLETLALLAAYGGWTLYDPALKTPIEQTHLLLGAEDLRQELIHAKSAVERNKNVSEDELKRFSDIYLDVEALFAVAIDVHDLLTDGKIDEANALYRDKSVPLIKAINADSYTLISTLQEEIDKAALHAHLAK